MADTTSALSGQVTAQRKSASEIVGTSPDGDWRAYLPLNGRTAYYYPAQNERVNAAIRRCVAQLVK